VRKGWSVYLGARWEGVTIRTTGDAFAPVASHYSVFSPLAQTLWKIPGAKQDQLRLALTRTYRAPALSRLLPTHFYTSFNNETSPDFLGNPKLKPELATGLDAAWEHYFEAGGLVSLSATSRAIRDYIRNTIRYDGVRWVSQPGNQGKARVYSIALEAKLPLKTFGSSLPVELRGNLSRNWSTVDSVPGPANRLDQQPRWSANLLQLRLRRLDPDCGYRIALPGGHTRPGSVSALQIRSAPPTALHGQQPAGNGSPDGLTLCRLAPDPRRRRTLACLPHLAFAVRAEVPIEPRGARQGSAIHVILSVLKGFA
jgi:hypothetical protein